MRVPRHVMFGIYMVRCSFFKRQNDVCYTCGQPGHRADVCVNPNSDACKNCGIKSPSEGHPCTPKCAMCGGAHPTGSKTCKHRFQVSYVVRQRRRQRSCSRRRQQQLGGQSRHPSSDVTWRDRSSTPAGQRRSALRRERSPSPGSRRRSVSKGRSHSRQSRAQSRRRFRASRRSESRGRSGQQDLQTSSLWADKVKEGTVQDKKQVTPGPLPEHVNDPRVDQLVAENRQMSQKHDHVTDKLEKLIKTLTQVQEENARLKAENEALRAEKVSPPTSPQVEVFGSNIALDGVDLVMYEKTCTVLLGHNGAGKTTLMSVLTGAPFPSDSLYIFIKKHVHFNQMELHVCTTTRVI
ncbi:hypothetical protein HPB48_024363 [Haemaphysalis longicornis]|uniref:CCHC-type domain-containing protein n=1 Tax=Haemaphysalis longicornis TaxID=44386 RepID=A0A9J6H691_HAELO|nr:hypothetical protein HPB48_024363 [Haemaphysalis longicornis]